MEYTPQFMSIIREFQQNEITEHLIYQKIAKSMKSEDKRKIIQQIANDEKSHYEFWKSITNEDIKPNKLRTFYYYAIIHLLGINQGIKQMEKSEQKAFFNYTIVVLDVPNSQWIVDDEASHEEKLIQILEEK
jgi:vacuolar iron transporter family protein